MYEESKEIISNNVKENIRLLIGDFSILWNLYEKYIIVVNRDEIKDKNAQWHDKKIDDVKVYQEEIHDFLIDKLKKENYLSSSNGSIVHNNFNELKDYLEENNKVNKMFNANNINEYFHISDRHRNENKEVIDLFKRNKYAWDDYDKLHLLLVVIYRVRNNMFHGTKIITKLNSEERLFIICNNIITMLLNPIEYKLQI